MGDPYLGEWHPSKNPGHQSLGECPWLAILHTCYLMLLLREWSIVPVIPLGEGSWRPLSSWTSPYVPFSFASLYLYPFSAINYNLQHDNYVSSVAPLTNHQAWGWSQNPWHIQQHILSTYHMPNTVLNTQDSCRNKERQWPLPSWSSELGYVLGIEWGHGSHVHFLLTIQLYNQKQHLEDHDMEDRAKYDDDVWTADHI